MLTKAQQLMVEDGFPPELFRSEEDRAADWLKNPPRAMPSFKSKSQEYEMPKWKITCLDAEGKIIERGSTSVPDDTGQVELFTKMGAAYFRCAKGAVKKVRVESEAGELIREWEEGHNAEFPKPDPKAPKPAPKIEVKSVSAAKPNGKAKPGSKTKGDKASAPPSKGKGKEGGIKKVGVIATIVETMSRKSGASVPEIVAVLMKKFPDRDEKGMTSTVRIQANKQSTSKEKDDKRGTVYYHATK